MNTTRSGMTKAELNGFLMHMAVLVTVPVTVIALISGHWIVLPLTYAYIGANRIAFGWLWFGDPDSWPRRMWRKFGLQGLILLGLAAAIPSTLACMWVLAR